MGCYLLGGMHRVLETCSPRLRGRARCWRLLPPQARWDVAPDDSTGDQPWGETLRGPALVGMAEPALCVPFLGTFTAQAGTGSRSGIWGTQVPRGAGVGLLSCLLPSLAAGVGWDGGRIQIRSGSGGAE